MFSGADRSRNATFRVSIAWRTAASRASYSSFENSPARAGGITFALTRSSALIAITWSILARLTTSGAMPVEHYAPIGRAKARARAPDRQCPGRAASPATSSGGASPSLAARLCTTMANIRANWRKTQGVLDMLCTSIDNGVRNLAGCQGTLNSSDRAPRGTANGRFRMQIIRTSRRGLIGLVAGLATAATVGAAQARDHAGAGQGRRLHPRRLRQRGALRLRHAGRQADRRVARGGEGRPQARWASTQVDGVLTEFGSLIPGLQAGRFDIIAAGMFVTPEALRADPVLRADLRHRPGLPGEPRATRRASRTTARSPTTAT